MSTDLAREQQSLLAALWEPRRPEALERLAPYVRGAAWERGLAAYRSNGLALAERALGAAYPVVAALVGLENFSALTRECWRRHPPRSGDLSVWSGELPAVIESLDDLRSQEPYLADVCRVEWALHQAASAADVEADLGSLALLGLMDPEQIDLRLTGGVRVVQSAHAVASVTLAHLGSAVTLAQAGERLRAGVGETALVWRQGLRPCVREALPGEPALLVRLLEGAALATALQAAPDLDFQTWLEQAVSTGLLLGAAATPN